MRIHRLAVFVVCGLAAVRVGAVTVPDAAGTSAAGPQEIATGAQSRGPWAASSAAGLSEDLGLGRPQSTRPDATSSEEAVPAASERAYCGELAEDEGSSGDCGFLGLKFKRPRIGVDYSIFIPADGKTQNRFGSTWSGLGIGIGGIEQPGIKGRFGLDFGLVLRSSGAGHVWKIPLGIKYQRALLKRRSFRPFLGVAVDANVVDIRSDPDNVQGGIRLGNGASGIAGITVGETGYVRARYNWDSSISGFDLSGLSLGGGVRF